MSQIGSEYNFDDINGPKKEEFMTRISAALAASVNDFGVDINSKNGVSVIGALRPPTNLRDAINARVQAIQQSMKAENELRTVTAEAKKAVATAEGEAASMRAKSASITSQFMELRKLEIQEKAIAKWNGTMPATMMGSGSNVMFNIPMK